MKYRKLMITLLLTICLASCASPQRRLELAEKELGTDGSTAMLFHSSLYYPAELSLRFDGFLVGIEKSPREKISSATDLKIRALADAGLSSEDVEKKLHDRKLLYISHVIDNQGEHNGMGNCTLYNAYNQQKTASIRQLAPACPNPDNKLIEPIDTLSAYTNSWRALDKLRKSMAQRIQSGKYSHIIVITMGWNTVQEEAVRNFNSIVTSMKSSADPTFNPLVIGVTWPSSWESEWIEPVIRLVSFPVKAFDADELGLSWLGALLHQTIPSAIKEAFPDGNKSLRVVVIGHSFGSRASSVAACVGPAIYENDQQLTRTRIDTLINLQGAFRAERLFGEEDRGFHYPTACENVDNLVLTSSVNDKAMKIHFWGTPYAGDDLSYKKYCDKESQEIRCAKATSEGKIISVSKPSQSKITYIDASDLIKENAYLSGGGAHSDIYRREHGILLNKLIDHSYPQN